MKLQHKFQRSKVFTEVLFAKTIPNKLLIEKDDGRVYLYCGKVDDSKQRMETGTKPLASWSRLDNAKNALQKREVIRIQQKLANVR